MSISSFPNPNVDIFNNEYWSNNNSSNSSSSGDYVNYPIAQGTVTFPVNAIVNNNLAVHNSASIDNNLLVSGNAQLGSSRDNDVNLNAGFTYIGTNLGSSGRLPQTVSQHFGCISGNQTNGHAEVDLWNTNYSFANTTNQAFSFRKMSSETEWYNLFNILSNKKVRLFNNIIFNDTTEQSTAFTDLVPSPANTYTNPSQIIVNSKGQITSITSGSGQDTNISIVSNNSSIDSWIIDTTTLTKKYYQFYLYSTNGFASNNVSAYVDNTSIITPSTVGLVLTGLLAKVDNVFQTNNRITYCGGFQQNYNWSKNTYGYLASNINNYSTAVDIVSRINGVDENELTCPPSAGDWSGCQLEITIKDTYVKLPSASTLTLVCFSLD